MAWVNEGLAIDKMTFFAHHQTSGKGQHDKTWHSKPSQNILLSSIFDLSTVPIAFQPVFNMAVSVTVAGFYASFLDVPVKLKWPNDLYVNDKKAAGILIENRIKGGNWQWSIVGMGININETEFSPGMSATSLQLLTGKKYQPVKLSKMLLTELFKAVDNIRRGEVETICFQYNDLLYKRNMEITLLADGKTFSGIVKGVDENGRLIISHAGQEMRFSSGEAKWLLIQ